MPTRTSESESFAAHYANLNIILTGHFESGTITVGPHSTVAFGTNSSLTSIQQIQDISERDVPSYEHAIRENNFSELDIIEKSVSGANMAGIRLCVNDKEKAYKVIWLAKYDVSEKSITNESDALMLLSVVDGCLTLDPMVDKEVASVVGHVEESSCW